MGETPGGHATHTPHWTPDGAQVVFEHDDSIFIVNPDGTGLESILGGSGRFDWYNAPSIPPDGQRIAYTTFRHSESGNNFWEVETSRLDGSDKRRLTEERAVNAPPVWSPDGTRIAYLRGGSALVTMAADGSDVRELTEATGRYVGSVPAPAWSPDGRYIAFVDTEEEPEGSARYDPPAVRDVLYSVNADGSGVHRVAEAVRSEGISNVLHLSNPAWSPDGLLTFGKLGESNDNGIYVGNPDGSNLRQLVDGFGAFHVAWAPDGAELLFSSDPYLYAVGKDGAGLRKLLRRPLVGFASSPDGSRVASFIKGRTPAFVSVVKDGTDLRILAGIGFMPSAFRAGPLLEINPGVREQPSLSGCSTGAAVPEPEANPNLVQDCRTLLEIRDTLAGTATLDWNDQTPIAEWEGISVEGSPLRVTELYLYGRVLTGTLTPKLSRLTALRKLRLGANWLTGAVPTELASLENLEQLYAPDNYLSGRIPPELGALTRLRWLELAGNSLQGPIDEYRFRLTLEGNLLEDCVDRNANADVSGLEECPSPTVTPRPTSTASSGN